MLSFIPAVILAVLGFVRLSFAATATCTPFSDFSLAGCPYAAPSTSDLEALIQQYCDGSYCQDVLDELPCYDEPSLSHETADGQSYYQVSTEEYPPPGTPNDPACYAAFQSIVDSCNSQYGEYGWYDGYLTANGRPYDIITCQLA